MSDLDEKIRVSIERLKAFEPEEGYYLADSGGKDSTVCHALLEMSGCKHDDHYRLTSVDPPELVNFIKRERPTTLIEKPRYEDGSQITMWNLIPKKLMPPTRMVRYCCSELKEDGGNGRLAVTGVRWEESARRKNNQGLVTIMRKSKELEDNANFMSTKAGGVVLVNDNEESRRMVEHCYQKSKTVLNPIIDWTYRDVWDFIHAYGIHYTRLTVLRWFFMFQQEPRNNGIQI